MISLKYLRGIANRANKSYIDNCKPYVEQLVTELVHACSKRLVHHFTCDVVTGRCSVMFRLDQPKSSWDDQTMFVKFSGCFNGKERNPVVCAYVEHVVAIELQRQLEDIVVSSVNITNDTDTCERYVFVELHYDTSKYINEQ